MGEMSYSQVEGILYNYKIIKASIENNKIKLDDPLVYVDALLRHTYELLDGNFFDEESGLCHGDAIVWNAQAFTNLLYKKVGYQQKYLEQDNEICAISWLNMLKKSAYPDNEYQMSINDYEYNIDTSVDYVRKECSE